MPTTLANSRKRRLTEAHFKFVAQNESYDQLAAIALRAFTAGHRRRKDIRWVRWVLFPIDVGVIHAANHQCIGKRGRDWINLFSPADHGRWLATRDFIDHLELDLDVVLLISAKRAADGMQETTFRLVHGVLRVQLELAGRRSARHFRL